MRQKCTAYHYCAANTAPISHHTTHLRINNLFEYFTSTYQIYYKLNAHLPFEYSQPEEHASAGEYQPQQQQTAKN